MNYNSKNKSIVLDNQYVILDKRTYIVTYLNEENHGSKGGNSFVFRLFDLNDKVNLILKVCKFYKTLKGIGRDRNNKFSREINALNEAKNKELGNIIKIFYNGEINLKDEKSNNYNFQYYIMEEADSDLQDFLKNNELDIQSKLQLCREILNGLLQLHSMDLYHRDIKPDNIFVVDKTWKIGDLGLVGFRDKDLDLVGDKIGPKNWYSPEAINKFLTEKLYPNKFDCSIDNKSDFFQLGQLFWFIIQGNFPTGQIKADDLLVKDNDLFTFLEVLLQHSKSRRLDTKVIYTNFSKIADKYYA